MILGILICDQVQPALRNEFGDYPQMFSDILGQIEPQVEIRYFSAVEQQLPSDIDQCDAYMTSGSKCGVNDDLVWIRELEDFIRRLYQANKALVGICFGHQLITKALGGQVEKSAKGWGIGIAESQVQVRPDWMSVAPNNVNLIVSHQDQIVELPPATTVLMSSDFCPYSMILVGQCFIGIQGHPEFSRQYSLALMNARRDRIPAAVIETGASSLNGKVDDLAVMKWLVKFLDQV